MTEHQKRCPLHDGIRECKCKIIENECGIRIETERQIYKSNGDSKSMKNKCKSTYKEADGTILECCRTDSNHEKKGLWHRKGRTYW